MSYHPDLKHCARHDVGYLRHCYVCVWEEQGLHPSVTSVAPAATPSPTTPGICANTTALPHAKATFDRAYSLISGNRRDAYGDVHSSFARIALTWSGVLGVTVTAQQVALCMIALKLCREANRHKQDSIDDMCGYAGLLAELAAATNPTPTPPAV